MSNRKYIAIQVQMVERDFFFNIKRHALTHLFG